MQVLFYQSLIFLAWILFLVLELWGLNSYSFIKLWEWIFGQSNSRSHTSNQKKEITSTYYTGCRIIEFYVEDITKQNAVYKRNFILHTSLVGKPTHGDMGNQYPHWNSFIMLTQLFTSSVIIHTLEPTQLFENLVIHWILFKLKLTLTFWKSNLKKRTWD